MKTKDEKIEDKTWKKQVQLRKEEKTFENAEGAEVGWTTTRSKRSMKRLRKLQKNAQEKEKESRRAKAMKSEKEAEEAARKSTRISTEFQVDAARSPRCKRALRMCMAGTKSTMQESVPRSWASSGQ